MSSNEILVTCIALAVTAAVILWALHYLKKDPHIKQAAEQLAQARLDRLKHLAQAEVAIEAHQSRAYV